MKSRMVEQASYLPESDKGNYSPLQVLRSPAGYYIGTLYTEHGFTEPGSRDSDYFPTRQAAEKHLSLIEQGNMTTRMQP
jgi:hypothetical protein